MHASVKDLLLVAVDFSKHSLAAAAYGAELAKRLGARLVLLHVLDTGAGRVDESRVRDKRSRLRESEALERLQGLADDLAGEGMEVSCRVLFGSAAEAIAREGERAHMVIMGTRGVTAAEGVLTGSVAGLVLEACRAPVLTIRDDGTLARVA